MDPNIKELYLRVVCYRMEEGDHPPLSRAINLKQINALLLWGKTFEDYNFWEGVYHSGLNNGTLQEVAAAYKLLIKGVNTFNINTNTVWKKI